MTVSYVSARDALVARINTAWAADYPTIPIFYENTTKVDMDAAGDMFLLVSIDFNDAVQSDIDLLAIGHQAFGEVIFRLFAKEGKGTRATLAVFDYLTTLMKLQDLTGVRTGVPHPGKKHTQSGWMAQDLVCPVDFYSNY